MDGGDVGQNANLKIIEIKLKLILINHSLRACLPASKINSLILIDAAAVAAETTLPDDA